MLVHARLIMFAMTLLAATGPVFAVACGRQGLEATTQSASDVVAQVGDRAITLAQVDEKALQASASDFSGTLRQALYDSRREAIDQIVADHLIEAEAKARGISSSALFQKEVDAHVTPVTESEVEAWYRANPQRVQGASLDQVRTPIRNMLARDRRQVVFNAFLSRLKAKTPVRVTLEPPRAVIEIADDEPAVGSRSAKVQIVEYSDFQ